ncbi:MAG: NUDIX hydrolase [Chloroflexota bacterium]
MEATARRELLEEFGGETQVLSSINFFFAHNGITNTRCDVYLARDVALGRSSPESTELIEIVIKPKDEVLEMAYQGEITDGMSALAIMLSQPHW